MKPNVQILDKKDLSFIVKKTTFCDFGIDNLKTEVVKTQNTVVDYIKWSISKSDILNVTAGPDF